MSKLPLSLALGMKKQQAKRKMASGGPVSAKTEKRAMPDQLHNDMKMAAQSEKGEKPVQQDNFLSRPDKKQMAPKMGHSINKIKTPRQAGEPPYKARLEGQEQDFEVSMPPASIKEQPEQMYDEKSQDESGPQHPLKGQIKPKFAKGGSINDLVSFNDAEQDNLDEPMNLEADKDMEGPSMHEVMSDHFAKGGAVGEDMQPEEEAEMEHHDSIAAAIMAKRAKMHAHVDSGALDEDDAADHMYADGGQVDIMDNGKEEASDAEYTMRNKAALRENYDMPIEDATQPADSNMHGDEREDETSDKHDMVSKIRAQIMKRKQFR